MWTMGDQSLGGLMAQPDESKKMGVPPYWLAYIETEDVDATLDRIKKAGGKILNGPMDIPGNDKIAQCMDPQGAAFAIYMEGKK